jgi:diadenosine tetraphosphate (Ap4A) HIT family hydrolase
MNATLKKFGHPQSLLWDYQHWCVLLRPQQVTLGALVLAAKHDATSFGSLPATAHAELATITAHLERALNHVRPHDKLNYLALMMVDPHVHFHVLPRYAAAQTFADITFEDRGWPALPDLKAAPMLEETARQSLHAALLDAFRQTV